MRCISLQETIEGSSPGRASERVTAIPRSPICDELLLVLEPRVLRTGNDAHLLTRRIKRTFAQATRQSLPPPR